MDEGGWVDGWIGSVWEIVSQLPENLHFSSKNGHSHKNLSAPVDGQPRTTNHEPRTTNHEPQTTNQSMPSPRIIRPTNHPFPFLLYMEWALLGLAIASELTPTLLPRVPTTPVLSIACIISFGVLGLWLPKTPISLGVAHVAGQFSLILLASRAGVTGLRLFPLLLFSW